MSEDVSVSGTESSSNGSDGSNLKDINPHLDSEGASTKPRSTQQDVESIKEVLAAADPIASDADGSDIQSGQHGDNEARLQQLEKEHETLHGQYVRIAADFDNFRKRQSRDQDDLRLQLTCTTLSSILPVVDNFERARQQLEPQGEEAQALHRSYQGLYKQLVDVLKQLGVAPMRVVGQLFDPTLHEAVLREPSDEKPEDIVIEELQRGYHLNGRVLRHALVKVSMGPGPKDGGFESSEEASKELDSTEGAEPSPKEV